MNTQGILNAKQRVATLTQKVNEAEQAVALAKANQERYADELRDLNFDLDGDLDAQTQQMEADLNTLLASIEADVTKLQEAMS